MDNLGLDQARNLDGHIGPVGTHIRAVLTHRGTAQTPLCVAAFRLCQNPFPLVNGLCLHRLAHILGNGLAQNGLRGGHGVGHALDYQGRTVETVADDIHARYAGFQGAADQGAALLIHVDAVCLVIIRRHLFAYCGNHRVRRHQLPLPGGLDAGTAGSIHGAQGHFVAQQGAVLHLHRSQKLFKFHTVLQGKL